MKTQIQHPKSDNRHPKEVRKPRSESDSRAPGGDSDFGVRTSFGLRISAFGFLFLCLLTSVLCPRAFAQGTAFTYQGQLNDGSSPVSGNFDLRFTIYDSTNLPGTIIAGPLTNAMVVSNGLFAATLDFGSVFPGAERWLEIAVRTNGASFAALSPRQKLTPTPYAITASILSGVVSNTSMVGLYTNSVTFNNTGNNFFGNGAGLIGLNASQLANGTVPSAALSNAWKIGGNAGTTPGTHFLGTTDNQPLEIKVNGLRTFRLVNPGDSAVDFDLAPDGAPNVIGGAPVNFVTAGVVGATIAGGGATNYGGFILTNSISADFSVVGGGGGNRIYSAAATIAGGRNNIVHTNADVSAIGGGELNVAASVYAAIPGGFFNHVDTNSEAAAVGGGNGNTIRDHSPFAAIAGGLGNVVGTNSPSAAIGGGTLNVISNSAGYASIAGGYANNVGDNSDGSSIGGGARNVIGDYSPGVTIAGGSESGVGTNADGSVIGGGFLNHIGPNSEYATIAGGYANDLATNSGYSAIGGGGYNTVARDSTIATIAGGAFNDIGTNSSNSVIGGGYDNDIAADSGSATIAGGNANDIANSFYATVGGGNANTIAPNASFGTIAGGDSNRVGTNSSNSAISGGQRNTVLGNASYGTIPGGRSNVVASFAFAAGYNALATNLGALVWSDSVGTATGSTNSNSVTLRARGGYRFFSDGGTNGVYLAPGGGSWINMSDRNAKENFTPIDSRAVLDKVAALPLHGWNYKSQADSIRHLGPMAQDFRAAFGLGETDTGIATVDADGVALAAIQGLNQKVEAGGQRSEAKSRVLEEKLHQKETEITELKRRLERLERLIAENFNE